MKKLILLILLLIIGSFTQTHSWGFFAHKTINRLAVFTVPPPLLSFYKQHIEYLTIHAVDADKRRYSAPDEAACHYLDADHYEDILPLDTIPRRWKDAIEKYGEDSLRAYGIVPWHIHFTLYRLTKAFEEQDLKKILRLSADIGHYVGDCHVPLHTTENYNGQLTGQHGIHGFWESRLPELFSSEYDFYTGPAQYIENPQTFIWEVFEASVAARDSVLRFERELNESFPSDKKYAFEQRGNATVKVYSFEYSKTYHQMLNGMVERRMRAAVRAIGSLWYTAWINAGQPALDSLDGDGNSEDGLTQETEAEKKFKLGRILGREEPQ